MTPEAETALRHKSGEIVEGVVVDLNIGMRMATQIVTSKLAEESSKMKTDIVDTLKTESEQAANRFKQSQNYVVIHHLTAYILAILLMASLSLNLVVATFNIHLWGFPTLTNILWIFLASTISIITITIALFRWWNNY